MYRYILSHEAIVCISDLLEHCSSPPVQFLIASCSEWLCCRVNNVHAIVHMYVRIYWTYVYALFPPPPHTHTQMWPSSVIHLFGIGGSTTRHLPVPSSRMLAWSWWTQTISGKTFYPTPWGALRSDTAQSLCQSQHTYIHTYIHTVVHARIPTYILMHLHYCPLKQYYADTYVHLMLYVR